MVVHTNQGLRERRQYCGRVSEGGVGNWGGGCFNSEHNSVLLFLSLHCGSGPSSSLSLA